MHIIPLTVLDRPKCRYEGPVIETERREDRTEEAKVRICRLHQKCTRGFVDNLTKWCQTCSQYIPEGGKLPPDSSGNPQAPQSLATRIIAPARHNRAPNPRSGRIRNPIAKEGVLLPLSDNGGTGGKGITWTYGVTTVPDRKDNTFPLSLESLRRTGFDRPTLFVDGASDPQEWERTFRLPVTVRYPRIGAYGNWVLALAELYIRNPYADRYAIFQDDIKCVKNLRAYLDRVTFPSKGYLNLYTFPENQALALGRVGFYAGNRQGKGALGLVFNREGVQLLLAHNHMVNRVLDKMRGHKFIDGAVVETMNQKGWVEYVHCPSLLQHTGVKSTLQNPRHPNAPSYPGDEFDALTLLPQKTETVLELTEEKGVLV